MKNRKNFFTDDPYRNILIDVFEPYRDVIKEKAKIFYKKWKGDLRGWNHYVWYGHSIHNTLEDPKGGFHFIVNPRYIPLKQLFEDIEKAGLKIVERRRYGTAMRLFGDETGPNKSEVFVRVLLK